MAASSLILIAVLAVPVVLLLVSAGCGLDESGLGSLNYHDSVINDPKLVSYWRLDDSGSTAQDAKDGNQGTYKGTVSQQVAGLIVGDSDTAADFDGQTAYVAVPFTAALNPPKFSVEALVKPDQAGSGTSRAIVAALGDPQTNKGYGIYIGADDKWQFWYGDGTTFDFIEYAQNPVFYDLTTHVVATYDGTTARLYVDHAGGDPEASKATAITPSTSGELRIGAASNYDPPGEFFPGVIDEVAVYNDALDDTTIGTHYAASGASS